MDIQMKLDDTGVAYFVERVNVVDRNERWIGGLATSPILEDLGFSMMTRCGDNSGHFDNKFVSREAQTEIIKEAIKIETRNGKFKRKNLKRKSKSGHSRNSSKTSFNEFVVEDLFPIDDLNDKEQEDEKETQEFNLPRNFSFEFANCFDISNSNVAVSKKDLISLPRSSSENEALKNLLKDTKLDDFRPLSVAASFHYFSDGEVEAESYPNSSCSDTPLYSVLSDSEFETLRREDEEQNFWRWGELPNTANSSMNVSLVIEKAVTAGMEENIVLEEMDCSETKNQTDENDEDIPSVYLDDIMEDPDKLALYINPIQEPVVHSDPLDISEVQNENVEIASDEDCESGHLSLPTSPRSGVLDPSAPSEPETNYELSQFIMKHLPDIGASMCGGLSDSSITMERFEAKLLTFPEFLHKMKNPQQFMDDPSLVIRIHEKYVSLKVAAPILLCVMMFQKSLPEEQIKEILKDGIDVNFNLTAEEVKNNRDQIKKSSTWFGWFSGSGTTGEETKEVEIDRVDFSSQTEAKVMSDDIYRSRHDSDENTSENDERAYFFRKTLRLNNEQIAEMNLRPGINEVEFSVTTAFQGTTRCKCHIFLWHHKDKVVISDIDGTITRSDVLGHILPVIGKDWAQSGVAKLFTKIRANGYQIMYLSARAIGHATITKDYLNSVRQGDVCLPEGPTFLNPDSLYYAFRRELIDRCVKIQKKVLSKCVFFQKS